MRTPVGRVELQPGACLWLRPGFVYDVEQDPQRPLGLNYIHYDLLDPQHRPLSADDLNIPIVLEPLDLPVVDAITRRVIELLWFRDWRRLRDRPPLPGVFDADLTTHAQVVMADPTTHLYDIAVQLLTGLLMEFDAASSIEHPQVPTSTAVRHQRLATRAAMRLQENPADPPSIHILAREAGYSADHFTHVFKGALGKTPRDFVIDARINHAKQLLSRTDAPVWAIARDLGYEALPLFFRQFKHRTGATPAAFRSAQSTSAGGS